MNGLLGKFSLENSEEFFNNYKVNNTLAQEASTALDQFILDRKSTRLNSSHLVISYAVFCLKKKKINIKVNRESNRSQIRLKANQKCKKCSGRIKNKISTNRNNLTSGVDRCMHRNVMQKHNN